MTERTNQAGGDDGRATPPTTTTATATTVGNVGGCRERTDATRSSNEKANGTESSKRESRVEGATRGGGGEGESENFCRGTKWEREKKKRESDAHTEETTRDATREREGEESARKRSRGGRG